MDGGARPEATSIGGLTGRAVVGLPKGLANSYYTVRRCRRALLERNLISNSVAATSHCGSLYNSGDRRCEANFLLSSLELKRNVSFSFDPNSLRCPCCAFPFSVGGLRNATQEP